jgi:hypothetical protein
MLRRAWARTPGGQPSNCVAESPGAIPTSSTLAPCYQGAAARTQAGPDRDGGKLQEIVPRAWRPYDHYDRIRASLRTWLCRIALPLPSGLGVPERRSGRAPDPWPEPSSQWRVPG